MRWFNKPDPHGLTEIEVTPARQEPGGLFGRRNRERIGRVAEAVAAATEPLTIYRPALAPMGDLPTVRQSPSEGAFAAAYDPRTGRFDPKRLMAYYGSPSNS